MLSHHRHGRSFPERCAPESGIPKSYFENFQGCATRTAYYSAGLKSASRRPYPTTMHTAFDGILDFDHAS